MISGPAGEQSKGLGAGEGRKAEKMDVLDEIRINFKKIRLTD